MFGHTPDPLARTKRLLKIAQNELLDAEKSHEDWTAQVKTLRGRVARLEAACKPAPTQKVDGVTIGDITHNLTAKGPIAQPRLHWPLKSGRNV